MVACAFCGEMYADDRPNCPHCGADKDLTWSNDEYDPELGLPADEEKDYQEFLENEGLTDEPRKSGCLLFLALPPAVWAVLNHLI